MHEAIDQGMTFFDNAWDYGDGRSEQLMGRALATGGRRQKVFLMTKNCNRDYKGSMQHLEESLRRLKTDYLDLWQFHEINFEDAPERVFSEGGMKAALEAKKSGKVRFIGFTGHKDIDLHNEMLKRSDEWDTCQMPINILDAHYRSFQKNIVPVCNKRNMGVIGMKGLGRRQNPRTTRARRGVLPTLRLVSTDQYSRVRNSLTRKFATGFGGRQKLRTNERAGTSGLHRQHRDRWSHRRARTIQDDESL